MVNENRFYPEGMYIDVRAGGIVAYRERQKKLNAKKVADPKTMAVTEDNLRVYGSETAMLKTVKVGSR